MFEIDGSILEGVSTFKYTQFSLNFSLYINICK